MSKEQLRLEKYTQEQAWDEASELKKVIASGEAKNYKEAERKISKSTLKSFLDSLTIVENKKEDIERAILQSYKIEPHERENEEVKQMIENRLYSIEVDRRGDPYDTREGSIKVFKKNKKYGTK